MGTLSPNVGRGLIYFALFALMDVAGTALLAGRAACEVWVADAAAAGGHAAGDAVVVRCGTFFTPAVVRWGCPRGDCGACGWCACPGAELATSRPLPRDRCVISPGLAAVLPAPPPWILTICCAVSDRAPVATE